MNFYCIFYCFIKPKCKISRINFSLGIIFRNFRTFSCFTRRKIPMVLKSQHRHFTVLIYKKNGVSERAIKNIVVRDQKIFKYNNLKWKYINYSILDSAICTCTWHQRLWFFNSDFWNIPKHILCWQLSHWLYLL